MVFNFFKKTKQIDLPISLLDWQVQDLLFSELAFFILCFAAGGENLSLIDHDHVKKPYDNALYLGMITSDLSEPDADIELATCFGVGYYMDGLSMGSAARETKYWLEGALICLARHLDHPGILINLRLERASKYWDNQWNDIVRRTTEHLSSTDKEKTHLQKCPGKVYGADDPCVVLMVGLEVRMFKREQGLEEIVDEGARRKISPCSALRKLSSGKDLIQGENRERVWRRGERGSGGRDDRVCTDIRSLGTL